MLAVTLLCFTVESITRLGGGHFVVSGELIPLKDVRMLLKHAIHAHFFLTTADCYAMIHKFFETQKNKLDNRPSVG